MRHANKVNKLSRKAPHRKALMMNLANALIENKRITTTVAKAKVLRTYIEPLLTRAKSDTTHNRRIVFSQLKDKNSIETMFKEVGEKIANRPGGYTRIIKLENRPGDNATMALIELVDYAYTGGGEATTTTATETKKRTRRGGKKGGAKANELPHDRSAEPKHGSSKATGAPKIRQRKSGGA